MLQEQHRQEPLVVELVPQRKDQQQERQRHQNPDVADDQARQRKAVALQPAPTLTDAVARDVATDHRRHPPQRPEQEESGNGQNQTDHRQPLLRATTKGVRSEVLLLPVARRLAGLLVGLLIARLLRLLVAARRLSLSGRLNAGLLVAGLLRRLEITHGLPPSRHSGGRRSTAPPLSRRQGCPAAAASRCGEQYPNRHAASVERRSRRPSPCVPGTSRRSGRAPASSR